MTMDSARVALSRQQNAQAEAALEVYKDELLQLKVISFMSV